jgi:hypothetical protein
MNTAYMPSIACTLSAQDHKNRSQWMPRLASDALRSARRDDLRQDLEYQLSLEPEVRRVVAEESTYCSLQKFSIRAAGDSILVTIYAPDRAREFADVIFAQFATNSLEQSTSHE